MPGGRGKIKPEDRTNGFEKNPQNINKTGLNRKSPVTKYMEEIIYEKDGFAIEAEVIKNCTVTKTESFPEITIEGEWILDEFGDKVAIVKLDIPDTKAIALQWIRDAKSKNSKVRMRSRETAVDRLEGRATQTINLRIEAEDFHTEYLCPEIMKLTEYIFLVASGKKESDKKELLALSIKLTKDLEDV